MAPLGSKLSFIYLVVVTFVNGKCPSARAFLSVVCLLNLYLILSTLNFLYFFDQRCELHPLVWEGFVIEVLAMC